MRHLRFRAAALETARNLRYRCYLVGDPGGI